jgi:hypothetical protein
MKKNKGRKFYATVPFCKGKPTEKKYSFFDVLKSPLFLTIDVQLHCSNSFKIKVMKKMLLFINMNFQQNFHGVLKKALFQKDSEFIIYLLYVAELKEDRCCVYI